MPYLDEFLDNEMDGEDSHPVRNGDRLDGDRYKVVHKLGHGATSIVLLARDIVLQIYFAVKIKESGIFNSHNELDILNHLFKVKSDDHAGWSYGAASILLRHLWIHGPNGRYLAVVLSVRGPSISRLYYWNIRLHPCIARGI